MWFLMSFRFSTLFVGSLSVDHLHRVWDIFLYDGELSPARWKRRRGLTGGLGRHTLPIPYRTRLDQLHTASFTASSDGGSCPGTPLSPTSSMSSFRERVAHARCEREAQGRRRAEAADQNGATAQADDASATPEWHDERADCYDFTSQDMTPCPTLCVCVFVLRACYVYVVPACPTSKAKS